MNENYYKRWCEIQFYHMVNTIINKEKGTSKIDNLFNFLSIYAPYNPSDLKEAFRIMATNHSMLPGRNEVAVLAYTFKHKMKSTIKLIRMTNKTYYGILEKHFDDPMGIYPKLKDEKLLNSVVLFIEAYKNFKGEMFT